MEENKSEVTCKEESNQEVDFPAKGEGRRGGGRVTSEGAGAEVELVLDVLGDEVDGDGVGGAARDNDVGVLLGLGGGVSEGQEGRQ